MNGSPAEEGAADALEDELTIEQVSALLGLPTPTIRSWERRHGVPEVSRTVGGHRRYGPEQLAMLRRLRDLVAQGQRPVDAAARVKAERRISPGPLVEAFLQAATDLQPATITDILGSAEKVLGLDRAVDEVLMPGMRQIGEGWRAGRVDIAHEHLATHAAQAWLSGVEPAASALNGSGPLVFCCGPWDHHTLGMEAIAALMRWRAWDCRVLGARTPAGSLVRAVREIGAAAVVLVCHLPSGRSAALEVLRSLPLPETRIFYAGGAFAADEQRNGVPGHYLGDSLGKAAELITAALRPLGDGH